MRTLCKLFYYLVQLQRRGIYFAISAQLGLMITNYIRKLLLQFCFYLFMSAAAWIRFPLWGYGHSKLKKKSASWWSLLRKILTCVRAHFGTLIHYDDTVLDIDQILCVTAKRRWGEELSSSFFSCFRFCALLYLMMPLVSYNLLFWNIFW